LIDIGRWLASVSAVSFYSLLEVILQFLKKTAVLKEERCSAAYIDNFLDWFVN